ncbi:hypothetical protein N8J89_03760 [Crossiella sp. CA-258035]|uniref:hypothetical protein n=1 Tax=Crossiella sp. CA-258035 TaxID=2981138 RepID=UPI0024BCA752|nr:hypothetical protein [Crossiella sp. CA-258035]WHT20200.1 hypothetical protein N8J89_03760 [Crossiella sp. CA-258035]
MDNDQHLQRVVASNAKVVELQQELQDIREQEAALQARRTQVRTELDTARQDRRAEIESAIAASIPKVHIARAIGMDRTNLYKLLDAGSSE